MDSNSFSGTNTLDRYFRNIKLFEQMEEKKTTHKRGKEKQIKLKFNKKTDKKSGQI
jgi:hypothetical protein